MLIRTSKASFSRCFRGHRIVSHYLDTSEDKMNPVMYQTGEKIRNMEIDGFIIVQMRNRCLNVHPYGKQYSYLSHSFESFICHIKSEALLYQRL